MDFSLIFIFLVPLLIGWFLDLLLGDPECLPHPIVGFGKIISWGERFFNRGEYKILKGAIFSISSLVICWNISSGILIFAHWISPYLYLTSASVGVFYCLAGNTLIREVKQVFIATDSSVEAGRKQLARIVGRDTSELSPQQIRIAALETLAENLSDGVVAPFFWYALLGVPGMLTYKMINTLDSMIGYKNERYKDFGKFAAKVDDFANFIPARLTAFLMLLVTKNLSLFSFVKRESKNHSSPNSGYPEAALAGILNCRFGGPNYYFGQLVEKPFIGLNDRVITIQDMEIAVSVNRKTEIATIIFVSICAIGCSIL